MNKDVVVDGRRDHTSGDGINLQQHSKIECGVCEHHVFVGDTTAAKPGEAASCCAGEKIQGQAAHPGGLGFGAGPLMPWAGASMVQLAPRLLWPTDVADALTSAPVMADKVAANVLSRPVLQA